MTPRVHVLGGGRIGRAVAARLSGGVIGVEVSLFEPWQTPAPGADLSVLCLHDGAQVRRVLAAARHGSCGHEVLDLTTQDLRGVGEAARLAAAIGAGYCAGGVLGGAAAVRDGQAQVLQGPSPGATALALLGRLGPVRVFEDAAAACAAKLLHNLALILNNHAIALCLRLAPAAGIADIETVLDAGTAGRAPGRSSVARDFRAGGPSSYTSALVAKDLLAILDSFPALPPADAATLRRLQAWHAAGGDAPYTRAALDLAGGRE
jgi:3-hydroxyisobutyrate dehydrogenase-like beta-hydroxyacid dehydrogenase